ncbi:MAG: L-threonylcarbamoyladenylate synthase [Colwellia sp.]|nr:L-threonylcarbamoyladenylate synthase [Colwellia sp.]
MSEASIIDVFHQGGIIAYPTEAVFGLGCDPDNDQAINKLLALKNRSRDKGLILLAGNYSQVLPYIDDSAIPQDKRFIVLSRWPGPITQILPANKNLSPLISGIFKTVAVRITNHPDIVQLCKQTGKPIISTSANLSGEPTANTWQEVKQLFPQQLDYILKGQTLGLTKPSTIINAISGAVIRP